MTEWRPIETAPLMEPIIVTWKNDKGDPVVYMVCKNIISTRADTEHWETFNLDRIVSYWSSDMDGEDQLEIRPTHWMPLPPAPVDEINTSAERVKNNGKS